MPFKPRISYALVSRIRGAAIQGFPYKLIAKAAGVSLSMVRSIAQNDRRPDIPPDTSAYEALALWLNRDTFDQGDVR